jgi:hypothetical protein
MDMHMFDGLPLADVLSFTGDFAVVKNDPEDVLMREEDLGQMSDFEKKLYTIVLRRKEESNQLINTICGTDLSKITDEKDQKAQEKKLNKNATPEQKKQLILFRKDIKFLNNLMWASIKYRVPGADKVPSLILSEGYSITGGIDLDLVAEGIMMGMSGVMVLEVGSSK